MNTTNNFLNQKMVNLFQGKTKLVQFIIQLLWVQICSAQLPTITSNTSLENSSNSYVLKEYGSDFDFAIAYSERSSWARGSVTYKVVV